MDSCMNLVHREYIGVMGYPCNHLVILSRRCDPKCPSVKSDKYGYTQWMDWKRKKPSGTPETHMQTWPEFCEWGIIVKEKKSAR